MIYEFAVEPGLLATWADRIKGRFFLSHFGLGQPRLVSRFPKHWKRLVWEAFSGESELDRARLEEILKQLSEVMIERKGFIWDEGRSWLTNASVEHARFPFHAIISQSNLDGLEHVLEADGIDHRVGKWALARGAAVARKARDMAAVIAPMLRGAKVIVLVDPHFQPSDLRFRNPFGAFLLAAIVGRTISPPDSIRLLCSADKVSQDFFRTECERRLPRVIPSGLTVKFCRIRERDGSEKLHNRYVLTDLGAVAFNIGLDEGEEGQLDDVELLERAPYELRWRQYASESLAFDIAEEEFAVTGTFRG